MKYISFTQSRSSYINIEMREKNIDRLYVSFHVYKEVLSAPTLYVYSVKYCDTYPLHIITFMSANKV